MTTPVKDKRFFLTQKPPEGYIAGVSRGAIGFTTRSDIGSARNVNSPDVPGFGRQPGFQQQKNKRGGREDQNSSEGAGGDDDDDDNDDENGGGGGGGGAGDDTFDEFNGDVRFQDSSANYDQEDEEADLIWESIDKKMDTRKKKRTFEETKKKRSEDLSTGEDDQTIEGNSKKIIKEQLSDLKESLTTMSVDEWSSIPDSGDYSKRNALQKQKYSDFFTPIPDSLIDKARIENERTTIISTSSSSSSSSGTETTDLTQVGSARQKVLDLKLNQISDSVEGKTCIDPKGFLTEMSSVHITSDTEAGDIKRARKLFKSVTTTNPKFFPGWLTATKLEVLDGKISEAIKLITQACKACPESEEVWIEAAKLQTPEKAKAVLGEAIGIIPHSIRIWLYAMNLEKNVKIKKKIIRRALEYVPGSVKLWKEAVELEDDPNDAKILLGRAVECIPDNSELWLALANLETHKRARDVLNRARESIPNSCEIWIAAAQLEDSANNQKLVKKIIEKAIKSLSIDLAVMDREKWILEAEKSEKNGYTVTCQSIISEAIGLGIDQDDSRKKVWLSDAEESLQRGSIKTCAAIYSHIVSVFPAKKSVWLKRAQLEKSHPTSSKDSLDAILQEGIRNCPTFELLWLMRAKEKWIRGHIDEARNILKDAFKANPRSEEIWLAAVKIESEENDIETARKLLNNARETAPTERIYMKSSLLERELGHNEEMEIRMIEEGLLKFPTSFKLWLMKAQFQERLKKPQEIIRQTFTLAQSKCPNSVPIWIESSRFESRFGNVNRARSHLEVGRNKNPKNQDIYLELSRFESKYSNQLSQKYLAMGLQECGQGSGKLWAEIIANEPAHSKKNKCVDALNKCNNDPHVLLAVAKVFWVESKFEKAKEWFQRLTLKFSDFGDGFAYFYVFLLKTARGGEISEEANQLIQKCRESEPRYGEKWISISKSLNNSKLKSDQILKKVSLILLDQKII